MPEKNKTLFLWYKKRKKIITWGRCMHLFGMLSCFPDKLVWFVRTPVKLFAVAIWMLFLLTSVLITWQYYWLCDRKNGCSSILQLLSICLQVQYIYFSYFYLLVKSQVWHYTGKDMHFYSYTTSRYVVLTLRFVVRKRSAVYYSSARRPDFQEQGWCAEL